MSDINRAFQPNMLSEVQLEKFMDFVYKITRVKLTTAKSSMLSARLQKRMRACGISTFEEYYAFLQGASGTQEMPYFIDAVTTHKTDFFREDTHFQSLRGFLDHDLQVPKLRCWSAAASTGEEAYTLAMVLSEHPKTRQAFEILGTDISQPVLDHAAKGIYENDLLKGIPPTYHAKYLMKGKGALAGYHRIVPELRALVHWQSLNLAQDIGKINGLFHVIFLRNVMIYFDLETKTKIINDLENKLSPGGYLFLGHSESLVDIPHKLKRVQSTIYQKV